MTPRSGPEASPPPRCDVAVVGAGPAGALAATLLARRGFDVVQFADAPERARRPSEILTPAARLLLRDHDLREPEGDSAPCRGVLALWDEAEPAFLDYGLTQTLEGRAVDRRALQASLAGSAREAGASLFEARVAAQPAAGEDAVLAWRAPGGGGRFAAAGP